MKKIVLIAVLSIVVFSAGFFTHLSITPKPKIDVSGKDKVSDKDKIIYSEYISTTYSNETKSLGDRGLAVYCLETNGLTYKIIDKVKKYNDKDELQLVSSKITAKEAKIYEHGTVKTVVEYDNFDVYMSNFLYVSSGYIHDNTIPVVDKKGKFKVGDNVIFEKKTVSK